MRTVIEQALGLPVGMELVEHRAQSREVAREPGRKARVGLHAEGPVYRAAAGQVESKAGRQVEAAHVLQGRQLVPLDLRERCRVGR